MAYERMSTQRMVWRFNRPWFLRGPVWLLLAVPLLILARVVLTPIVETTTRTALAQRALDLRFADLDLSLFPPAYILEDVTVGREVEGRAPFHAERLEVNTSWGSVLSGEPAVHLKIAGAKWTASADSTPLAELQKAFALLPDARLGAIDIEGGEIYMKSSTFPWVANVQAAVGLGGVEGAVQVPANAAISIEGRGKVLGDATLVFKVQAASAEKPAHRAEVTASGVRVGSLEGFLAKSPEGLPTGAIDLQARWEATEGGELTGQTQLGVSTIATTGDPARLVTAIRDAFAPVLPDVTIKRVARQAAPAAPADQVALKGTIPAKDEALARAVVGSLRAMLVEGIAAAIENRAAAGTLAASSPAAAPAADAPAEAPAAEPPAPAPAAPATP